METNTTKPIPTTLLDGISDAIEVYREALYNPTTHDPTFWAESVLDWARFILESQDEEN